MASSLPVYFIRYDVVYTSHYRRENSNEGSATNSGLDARQPGMQCGGDCAGTRGRPGIRSWICRRPQRATDLPRHRQGGVGLAAFTRLLNRTKQLSALTQLAHLLPADR
jgi:hypothetical protein